MSNYIKLLVISLVIISCGTKDEGRGDWNQPKELPVLKVEKSNFTKYKSYPTKIEGVQEIEVRAKIDGYLQKIFVDEGQFVKKGQLLFQLETNLISQNNEALTASIKSAEASVQITKIEVNRLKPLIDKNIVSPIMLQTAQARLQEAQARLSETRGTLQSNKVNQQYAKITSPVDGYVGKLTYRQGSLIGPSTPLAMTTISNTEKVFAYFSISENQLTEITHSINGTNINEELKKLPPVQFQKNNGEMYSEMGKLEVTTGKIDANSGTIQLRAIFKNPKRELLSGNTGIIKIPTKYQNQLAIPEVSTMNMQNMKMVYVLTKGDTIQLRPIQVKDKVDSYLLIESGLKEGETILAQGLGKVYPNSKIKPSIIKADSLVNNYHTSL